MLQAFEIWGIMAAHLQQAEIVAFPLYRLLHMLAAGVQTLGECRLCEVLTGIEIVLYLPEYPRMAYRGTSYHHSICSEVIQHSFRILGCGDITIAEDRYMKAWVFFDFSYPGPVGFAGIH